MQKTSKTDLLLEITNFLTSDLLQEEIQQMPQDLQQIFDLVLDTHYGNSLEIRRKMLRIKEIVTLSAKTLSPFTENQIQQACSDYQNKFK
jgi:hypothetical protein